MLLLLYYLVANNVFNTVFFLKRIIVSLYLKIQFL
jgi:hypothetical protein